MVRLAGRNSASRNLVVIALFVTALGVAGVGGSVLIDLIHNSGLKVSAYVPDWGPVLWWYARIVFAIAAIALGLSVLAWRYPTTTRRTWRSEPQLRRVALRIARSWRDAMESAFKPVKVGDIDYLPGLASIRPHGQVVLVQIVLPKGAVDWTQKTSSACERLAQVWDVEQVKVEKIAAKHAYLRVIVEDKTASVRSAVL